MIVMTIFYAGNIGSTADNGLTGIPIIPLGEDNHDAKLSQDRYEVFVNGDKVGNKILLTQTDDTHDLDSYLQTNGFTDFEYKVTGDHIEIKTKQESNDMKEILSSYLSIR